VIRVRIRVSVSSLYR